MNRREQIIVGLAVLAGLYGAFEYGLRPLFEPPAITVSSSIDINAIMPMAQAATGSRERIEIIRRVLSAHEIRWRRDLFHPTPWDPESASIKDTANETITALDATRYTYSGYMRMNDEKIAIINGIDYKQGELVDEYRVEEILPETVILSRDGKRYSIRMEETE